MINYLNFILWMKMKPKEKQKIEWKMIVIVIFPEMKIWQQNLKNVLKTLNNIKNNL